MVSLFDGLPQHVCSYCSVLLLKLYSFKKNSQQAQNYLEDAKIVTPTYLTTYDTISLSYSPINITDSTETPSQITKHNDLTDDCHEDYEMNITDNLNNEGDLYTEHKKTNSKILEDSENCLEIENVDTITLESNLKSQNCTTKSTKNYTNKNILNKKQKNICKIATIVQKTSQLTKLNEKFCENEFAIKNFETTFDVAVTILNHEQQIQDVLDRKLTNNYKYSPYKCELCYKGFMDDAGLKKHVLYQHDESRGGIVCEICHFRYKDKRGLNQHLKSHRLKFSCRQCNFVSRTTFNAKEHYKMHTGLIHKCDHCGKSYDKLSSHLTHMRLHHPSLFIWCEVCGDAFIGQFGLNAHKKLAHRHLTLDHSCTNCGTNFTSLEVLNKHTCSYKCNDHTISCIHCGEVFLQRIELREHLISEHRLCTTYSCEKCDKQFSRQSLLSAHYRRAHVHSHTRVLRPCVCEVCGKTLPNKCVLQYHQRNHTGERPYQCAQCHKSFTMRKLLQSHLRVHSSDRPYSCKSCPKTFKGPSALRSHEQIHTGAQKVTSRNRKI
ncbi:uncharacterized protein LOC142985434 isoform X2 [Anticarsia gemmatalis]|uniref:uncharacterized protein LOC142985434 isoform X2 n=1 Tax=Anticarsia gemmatalis TaxID=129554 RepID=UPI003F75CEED